MISVDAFCSALTAFSYELVTGVPCSYLSGPIAELSRDGRYVPAANEGIALSVASGATLNGSRAAVIAQNSGFGNLLNPLTSLTIPYGLPVLVMMSLRGWPDPAEDEPQHEVMGRVSHALLDTLGVRHWTVPVGTMALEQHLAAAETELTRGRPAFLLFPKGTVAGAVSVPAASPSWPTRAEAIAAVVPLAGKDPVVATTGFTSRDLFAQADRAGNFYMQGSMGHASALALGLDRVRRGRGPVTVLDGDGAVLMHLGALSTIGAVDDPHLVHVIFDNSVYESTGGQVTTAGSTDFAAMARAAGYTSAAAFEALEPLLSAYSAARQTPGAHLLVLKVRPASDPAPPRASSALTMRGIRDRFSGVTVGTAAATAPSFWQGVRIQVGSGTTDRARELVTQAGPARVLLVASARTAASASVQDMLAGLPHAVFSDFTPNPQLAQVLAGARVRDRYQPDFIIAVGGGSTIDVAKALRVLPTGLGEARQWMADPAGRDPQDDLPEFVVIPTTAGPGTEVTSFATVYDGLRKCSVESDILRPGWALIDPSLHETCPPEVTSAAALDLIAHAVESWWSRRSQPRSRSFAGAALKTAVPLALAGLKSPTPADRRDLTVAALRAGMAIDQTRTTAAHAFAYPLTSGFGIPHGVACVLNLQWLEPANNDWLDSGELSTPEGATARDCLRSLREQLDGDGRGGLFTALLEANGWPTRLGDYGIAARDLPALLATGLGSQERVANNPVRLEPQSVLAALRSLL